MTKLRRPDRSGREIFNVGEKVGKELSAPESRIKEVDKCEGTSERARKMDRDNPR